MLFVVMWCHVSIFSQHLPRHILLNCGAAMIWISIHLPFIMAYVLASASLSKLVLAHDCSDTDLESLGESYVERSEEHIPDGLRWFYCAGLSLALTCMSKLPAWTDLSSHIRCLSLVY